MQAWAEGHIDLCLKQLPMRRWLSLVLRVPRNLWKSFVLESPNWIAGALKMLLRRVWGSGPALGLEVMSATSVDRGLRTTGSRM